MHAVQDLANLFLADNMDYWHTKDYTERYYILFADVDGNQWKVSIQDPTFTGTATQLTGGEFPVIWEGEGDESQDEVVLGSTGKLSLVCLAGQESIFSVGNLLPSVINDRRVQVMRYANGGWNLYWQGFIKPETFSQDWDRTPYEIELPIVSAVAALEYFIMPPPSYNGVNYDAYNEIFFDVSNIAGLIRAIIVASGCDFRRIVTNKPELLDMAGNTVMIPRPGYEGQTYPEHWTQGTASSLWYYDVDGGVMTPKTFKDVLENICQPYGKIHEYQHDLAFLMRTKDDAANGAILFYMPVWENYETGEISEDVRFGDYTDYGSIKKIALSSIKTAGTDNSTSNIAAPSSVKFLNDIDKKNEIFELSDKLIKQTLPLANSMSGLPIESVSFNGMTRYLYCIDKDYIDLTFADDWIFTNAGSGDPDMAFCRVIEVSGDSNTNVDYNITVPLGFCFNLPVTSGSTPGAIIQFTLKNGILTRVGRNLAKMTIKCYYIGEEDPINGVYTASERPSQKAIFKLSVFDENTEKYLTYVSSPSSGQPHWQWTATATDIDLEDFDFENNECTMLFNEDRGSNDNKPHKLTITLKPVSNIPVSLGTPYGLLFCTFKMEYQKSKTFYEDVLMGEFGNAPLNNGNNIDVGGGGEEISINFNTMAAKKQTIDGSMALPANSFCNAKTFIDLEQREKIEIEAAQFERYYQSSHYFDLALNYAVITDGSKVFIPVAVGMNPRMNTLKLTLVSTNVTS